MFKLCMILLFCLSAIKCFTPNCVPENQFRNFGFPVEACSDFFNEKCKFHPKGYFNSFGYANLVKIGETSVVPTCAFYNSIFLEYIYGVNSKIKVLATGAFIHLRNLKSIHLAFNYITEIRKGIFKDVSTELLDLSWNKIAFIDSNAFKEVSNLKFLNLSRNSLMTVSLNNLARTLINLNLAYNLLDSFALNSNSFLNLTSVDASNNKINKVAISFKYPAETLDLTNNLIQNFDYMDIYSVRKFKMGENLFEGPPRYLENINAQEIEIYPNPWKCDQLFVLWETLVSFNIRLSPKGPGKNPPPECSTSSARLITDKRSSTCIGDHECPTFMACRSEKCWDPCEESLCHSSSYCETKDHRFNCSCSSGLKSDPLDIHGECKNVECVSSNDCPQNSLCWDLQCYLPPVIIEEHTQSLHQYSLQVESVHYSSAQSSFEQASSGQVSSGQSLQSQSEQFSSGQSLSEQFSSEQVPSEQVSSEQISDGLVLSGVSEIIGDKVLELPEDSEMPPVPWWFEDIPSVVPPVSSGKVATDVPIVTATN